MRRLINDPHAVVTEFAEGFALAHESLLSLNAAPPFFTRKNVPVVPKVALVSGGGSGHEPLHAGYVGCGMLDAAVPGAMFSSPTPDSILAATLAAETGRVTENVRTMGVALGPCTAPHTQEPSFELGPGEIEIGIGIHGEPGRHRMAMESADQTTDLLLDAILTDLAPTPGQRLLLLINGMGGTPISELYIVYRRAAAALGERELLVERSLVGNYVTALQMQGASTSVLRLDDEIIQLWDAPVCVPSLRWGT